MIVNLINTLLSGGAAQAARRLHHGLLDAGVDSRFWYDRERTGCRPDRSYHPYGWGQPSSSRLARLHDRWVNRHRRRSVRDDYQRHLAARPPGLEPFSPATQRQATPWPAEQLGDVVHLHWIAQWLDYTSFFDSIPADHPVVWTLHDQNPLSGGCHFSGNCRAFETGCGSCPQLDASEPADLSRRTYDAKRRALAGKNLHVVAPSRWLTDQARRSPLLGSARSFHTLPNGLDLSTFQPVDKCVARSELGIADSQVVIVFGADSLTNPRKGMQPLLAALDNLTTRQPVMVLAFGQGDFPAVDRDNIALRCLGYLDDAARQALVYSAADMFVLPSLEDNLPQTGIESLACGTPVVGFATGGIPEMVEHGRTGLLAPVGDWRALATCIDQLADDPELRRRMSQQGRAFAQRNYDQRQYAASYLALYERLASETKARQRRDSRVA